MYKTARYLYDHIRTPKLTTSVTEYRANDCDTAVIFVHGFSGSAEQTWKNFIDLLLSDRSTKSWDVYSFGYPSNLRVDFPNLWSADPSLSTLALKLSTTLELPRFEKYKCIALVSHSMGGLIVQRVICDQPSLRKRISHIFLYGVPSAGLSKSAFVAKFKRQFRDMSNTSSFVTDLRADWERLHKEPQSFKIRSVAGDMDEFVPVSSSLRPFAKCDQRVVSGNHLTLIQPANRSEESYQILSGSLSGKETQQTYVDGAELALEFRRFSQVVDALLPKEKEIDDNAAITLSLALEGLGRSKEAISILEGRDMKNSETDIMGVLAGRLKRRWLANRIAVDFKRAKKLYEKALKLAERKCDTEQCYYHAINIAFLELMNLPDASSPSQKVCEIAQSAERFCNLSNESIWKHATIGEAQLMQGDFYAAKNSYIKAVGMVKYPRQIESMKTQAIIVCSRVFSVKEVKELLETFGYIHH